MPSLVKTDPEDLDKAAVKAESLKSVASSVGTLPEDRVQNSKHQVSCLDESLNHYPSDTAPVLMPKVTEKTCWDENLLQYPANAAPVLMPKVVHERSDLSKMSIDELKRRIVELESELEQALLLTSFHTGHSDIDLKWQKCHDVILCDHERVFATKLKDALKNPRKKIIADFRVPGANRRKEGNIEEMKSRVTPFGKVSFLGMIDDIYRVHRAGLSLDGNFSLEDFFWMPNKRIKLSPELKRLARERTPESVREDYHKLLACILLMVNDCQAAIPYDLEFLLDRMAEEDPDELLIRYNVCLMDEVAKRLHFLSMFDRMIQLEKEGSFDSTAGFKYIKDAHSDWLTNLYDNKYVKEAIETHRTQSKKMFWGPEDMLTIWRHILTHLPENAVKFGEIQYTDADVVAMMDYCSPGVISQFQAGMRSQTKVEDFPHLMRAMRA